MTGLSGGTGYFRRQHHQVRLGWDLVDSQKLRRAQLGAAWALSAHSTAADEPALVVLPTGVGKTLVLSVTPFLFRARRVLVVTPSKLVREQVAASFETFDGLKRAGVLPAGIELPKVVRVEGWATQDKVRSWIGADVVVGTPNVLSNRYEGVAEIPPGLFDLVLFDEAHHLPARVWTSILQQHDGAAALFTATPTRNDRKPLPGRLIYTYPLRTAIEDKVYSPVRFLPVHLGEDEDPDVALATAAKNRLEDAIHEKAGSRLLVRTNSRADAKRLVDVYAAVGIKVGLVLGDTSPKEVRATLSKVREGTLHGFVAVGAMIEGFDFPALKIATYHSPHRTLAPMLQFLGRLSRATPSGVRGELLAIPDQVEGETRELYRQDRDWAELMPEIVDAAEKEERDVRSYVSTADISGSLELAPRALLPPRSARIYRVPEVTPDLDVQPARIGRAAVVFRFYDDATKLVAFVTHRTVTQRWADSPMLNVSEFNLHLATWVEDQRVLFVSTESRPALDDLVELFGVDGSIRSLAPDDLVRLVHAADPGNYFSIGLRAAHARKAQGASYDTTAGAAAEKALNYGQTTNSTLGHFMARPKAGNRGTIGFAVAKSKLWEAENAGSLLAFRQWAVSRAEDLDKPAPAGGLKGLHVQMGEPFEKFPAEVIGAVLNADWLLRRVLVVAAGVVIDPAELAIGAAQVDGTTVSIAVASSGETVWTGVQDVLGRVAERTDSGVQAVDGQTGEVMTMSSALEEAPPSLFLRDGGCVVGNQLLPPRFRAGAIPDGVLSSDDWAGVDITDEVGASGSVQERTLAIAVAGSDWVATDHTSGELADFVALARNADGSVAARLYHCKGSGDVKPGRRVSDLYDLIGQSVKSVPWTFDPGWFWGELLRRLEGRTAFRIVSDGSEADFESYVEDLLATPPSVHFEIIAVQPGVSIKDLAGWEHGIALVHAANEWCSGANVSFHLLGSP